MVIRRFEMSVERHLAWIRGLALLQQRLLVLVLIRLFAR